MGEDSRNANLKVDTGDMPEEVAGYVQDLFGEISETLLKGKELSPVAFIGSRESGKLAHVNLDISCDEAKRASAAVVRKVAVEIEADLVIFIAEAWMLPSDREENMKAVIEEYGSIENCPFREDVVHVNVSTRGGEWVINASIENCGDSNCRIVGKTRIIGGKGEMFGGILGGLLPNKPSYLQ